MSGSCESDGVNSACGMAEPASNSGASGGPMICLVSMAEPAAGHQMVQWSSLAWAPRQLRASLGWKVRVARPARCGGLGSATIAPKECEDGAEPQMSGGGVTDRNRSLKAAHG